VTDIEEINALAARYSDAVSRLDALAAAATYAEDGVLKGFDFPEIRGRAQIADVLGQTLVRLSFLSQQCTGGMPSVDGDRAVARWNVQEWNQITGEEKLSACFGIYEDELVRTAQGWRFARRRFHALWRGRVEAAGKLYIPTPIEHPGL